MVMDAGLGGTSLDWVRVQPHVAKRSRVCTYDRAGYGWSELGPLPRTSKRIADELHTLLARAGESAPYVLVGHSFGGYNVRMFASRFPHDVAGLVLVDAAHEEQAARFMQHGIGQRTVPARGSFVLLSPPRVPAGLPAEIRPVALALAETLRAQRAVHGELASFRASAAQIQRAPPAPQVPMVVITRGQRVWPRTVLGDRMEQLWLDLQDDLAERRAHVPHVFARASGHYVQLDEPHVVVRAILGILRLIRRP